MPSPFPGMDPYIESSDRWGDFHTNMLSAIRAQLNARLPRRYTASVQEYVWVVEQKTRRRRQKLEPDVFVSEKVPSAKRSRSKNLSAQPATIELDPVSDIKRRNIQIVDRDYNRVVTAMELLSPGNKEPGSLRRAYLRKRYEYLANRVNLVEIDLLRRGPRLPLGNHPPEPSDYYVMVCRAWEYPKAGFWAFSIRDDLPEILVPLTYDTPDVALPLRPCLDRVYDESRYKWELHYDRPLLPPVRKQDAAWVRTILSVRPAG